MTSSGLTDCAATDATALPIVAAALWHGITTDTGTRFSALAPDDALDIVGIAEDRIDHLGRDIVDVVIRYDGRLAALFVPFHHGRDRLRDTVRIDAGHRNGSLVHTL